MKPLLHMISSSRVVATIQGRSLEGTTHALATWCLIVGVFTYHCTRMYIAMRENSHSSRKSSLGHKKQPAARGLAEHFPGVRRGTWGTEAGIVRRKG